MNSQKSKARCFICFVMAFSILQTLHAEEPKAGNNISVVRWRSLGTSETTTVMPTTMHLVSKFSALVLQKYLYDHGFLRNGIDLIKKPEDAQIMPASVAISPYQYAEYMREMGYGLDKSRLLDELDKNPDKNRKMNVEGMTYRDLLGKNWLHAPRKKRIELLKKKIDEMCSAIKDHADIRWVQIDKNVIGITRFCSEDMMFALPGYSELLELLGANECPEIIKDDTVLGYRGIVIDPFFCKEIPFQEAEEYDYNLLKVIGVVNDNLVLHVSDRLFYYNLRTKEFHREILRGHDDKEVHVLLANSKLYMLTVKIDQDDPRHPFKCHCEFSEGIITFH